jgi:hypothetical protein
MCTSLATPSSEMFTRGEGADEETAHNPMNRPHSDMRLARQSPRCGARTRAGSPCRCPAMKGKRRCRIHGGASPGAPTGKANGNYRTGMHTTKIKRLRAHFAGLVRQSRELLRGL